MKIISQISRWWNSYKFRFVPWITFKLKSQKTIREVSSSNEDKIISDENALKQIINNFNSLENITKETAQPFNTENFEEKLCKKFGFVIRRKRSSIANAGQGVFLIGGFIKKGRVVALYPGTVYFSHEPILIQSINNPFIFRCIDSVLIDGNDKRISKILYKSCAGRDRIGPFESCDETWFTSCMRNPYNIGQYVNNETQIKPANVYYHEIDIPSDIEINLRKYLPNIFFKPNRFTNIRTVALVANRNISKGEEILSSYFTVIKKT